MEGRFRTLYDRESKGDHPSSRGRGVCPVYNYLPTGEEGRCRLVPVGEKNLQAEIDSWRDSVEIHSLLERYFDGDVLALERRQAQFVDITGLPDNVHGWHNAAVTAETVFDSLSDDVRHFYGDSLQTFLQDIFAGRFPPAADSASDSGGSDLDNQS